MSIAVIGTGTWGTASALAIHRQSPGTPVLVWGRRPDHVAAIASSRQHPQLDNTTLDPAITFTADRAALGAAELVLWAVPTQHTRQMIRELAPALHPQAGIISLSKGLEQASRQRVSEILGEELGPRHQIGVLSGPSHAEEVVAGQPAALSLAGPEAVTAPLVAALHGRHVRLYTSDDLVGIELAGAMKNVIAIAAGITSGVGLGDNALAAVITRGLAEMRRLGRALGADDATYAGLSGIGDLMTTCYSPFGRNRALGRLIAEGIDVTTYLAESGTIAEGAWTSTAMVALADAHGVDVPIASQVASVCWDGKSVSAAIEDLLARSAKEEQA